jgi:hypothetical protein
MTTQPSRIMAKTVAIQPITLTQLLSQSALRFGERPALVFMGFSITLLSVAFYACSSSETKTVSTHQTRFVQVADSTKLEVLDWGGTGKPVLFLTGLAYDAHCDTHQLSRLINCTRFDY